MPSAQLISRTRYTDASDDAFAWLRQIGDDNPLHPYDLTRQQQTRAVMAMFELVSTFQVRYAIGACCTTGRNFLFGGCTIRPLHSARATQSSRVTVLVSALLM